MVKLQGRNKHDPMKTMYSKSIFLSIFISFYSLFITAQELAFPTAEGFGKFTSGGRRGLIYKVTNLNDDGEGSLRKGVVKHGARTIIFEISGTIDLKSPLDINNPNITIAGQTAPGEGICVRGYPVSVKANNVIIRYMRFRLGDANKVEGDAFGGRDAKNVIIDHCSISWATDENASFYRNEDFTMQWCIISEALNSSVHSKGDHGYGGIWGGVNATFHHNLLANNHSRNPRFSGSKSTANTIDEFVDFRNNVIYNWEDNSAYGGEKGIYNLVNNYYKYGPATKSSARNRIINPYKPYGKFYIEGNYVEGFQEVSINNWDGGIHCDDPQDVKLDEEVFFSDNVKTYTAQEAFNQVLFSAGASLHRDAVDERVVESVITGKTAFKDGIIDSQESVGGWPELKLKHAPKDTDDDGMPDYWEEKHGLNVNEADANNVQLHSYYTNVEVYINSLVAETNTKVAYDFKVDASGGGDFLTIQEAVNAVPDFRKNETRIYITNGIYKEKLVVPSSKTNLTFIGEDRDKTIITYDDYAQKANRFGEEMGTTGSSSCFLFGDDFQAKNLTFQNTAGPVGQAVAVRVEGDRMIFENCNFFGNQDTLYAHGRNSRQYYKNCTITGTVDFIFGWSTAVFEKCEIVCKDTGYITAASTEQGSEYGFVFIDCSIKSESGEDTHFLGRPWRDHAKTVFINTKIESGIKAEGWHNWNKPQAEKTTFYAEYNTQCSDCDLSKRVPWAHTLNSKEVQKDYATVDILKGEDDWNPTEKLK